MPKLTPEEAGNVPIEFEGNPQKLKGSITAFKGKMTREDRFINEKINLLVKGAGSDDVVSQLKELATQYKAYATHISALYEAWNCCDEISEETVHNISTWIDEIDNAIMEVDSKVHTAIANYARREGARIIRPDTAQIAPIPGLKPKIDALVPPTLTEDNSPSEYNDWKRRWRAYYEAAGMSSDSMEILFMWDGSVEVVVDLD